MKSMFDDEVDQSFEWDCIFRNDGHATRHHPRHVHRQIPMIHRVAIIPTV
jgi:hypothetical protein